MWYKLDSEGYISAVAFGCYLNNCNEYTGTVPAGYNNLVQWSDYACIQAYYIDVNGNLALDVDRLNEITAKLEQEAIDNKPLVRKDLYESNEIRDNQYKREVALGEVVTLEDVKPITPRVRIIGISPDKYSKLLVYTHGKNLMSCDAVDKEIAGVTFYRAMTGAIVVKGTATEDIEYTVSGSNTQAMPIFGIRKDNDYYLNLGGFECELRRGDGETEQQLYVGDSGLINLSQSIEVTHVVIKIPSGTTVDTTFFPQLEYGTAFTSHEDYMCKVMSIDISGLVAEAVYPSETTYPSDTIYPISGEEYMLIENGVVCYVKDGIKREIGTGNVGLFSNYDTIYTLQDTVVEIEYSTTEYTIGDSIGGWRIGDHGFYNDDYLVGMVNVGEFRFYVGRYTYDEIVDASQHYEEYPWFCVTDVGGIYGQELHIEHDAEVKGTLYTTSGTVSTSDRERKKDVSDLDTEKASNFIYSLRPRQYRMKNGARQHHGFIAQEVKESMGEGDWGVYVDSNPEKEGNKSLRYEELIADLVATVQSQNKRIEELERRLSE